MSSQATIPAIRRSVTVNASVEKAFRVFTESFASWWPAGHHINPNGYQAAFIEPRVGGRWYERAEDGSECDWGVVLAWEPPTRLLLGWQLNGEWEYDPDRARTTEIEIRFIAEGPTTTTVDLVHDKLERAVYGERLGEGVGGDGGWSGLLRRFAEAVEDRDPTALD